MHLLACHGDVSPSGADTPNGALLSGLDAGSTAWVPRARNMVALTATAPRLAQVRHPGSRASLFLTGLNSACHTDPMGAAEARGLLQRAWGWVWTECP